MHRINSKFILFSLFFFASWQVKFALGQNIDDDISSMVKVINDKNDSLLYHMMTEDAKVGDLTYPLSRQLLHIVLQHYASIESYDILSIDSLDDVTKARLHFQHVDGRISNPTVEFNKQNKIVSLNIIRTRKENDPVALQAESLSVVSFPDTVSVEFKLRDGLIYIPATMNGIQGYFMLDTGCPLVMLNSEYLDKSKLDHSARNSLQGIGGAIDNGIARDVSMTISELQVSGLIAPASPMGSVEDTFGVKVFGLIGFELIKQYGLLLDYQTSLMKMVKRKTGAAYAAMAFGSNVLKAVQEIPFDLQRHIAIVPLEIGDVHYRFGLDCGANANVFKTSVYEEMKSHFDSEGGTVSVTGMGSEQSRSEVGYIIGAKLQGLPLVDMYTIFSSQKLGAGEGDQALEIDGLLGTSFFNQFITEVDYVNKKLVIYR